MLIRAVIQVWLARNNPPMVGEEKMRKFETLANRCESAMFRKRNSVLQRPVRAHLLVCFLAKVVFMPLSPGMVQLHRCSAARQGGAD
jgi:hypothetical protein